MTSLSSGLLRPDQDHPDQPIGIFDSGVGGLTVAAALRRLMPAENLIYVADAARQPYGTKTAATVTRYARQAARYLASKRIKLLVIACNTASAHAGAVLRSEMAPLPVHGVVEAGAEAASRATRAGGIVVAATEGTCQSGAFPRTIAGLKDAARVTQVPCPLFVALAEEGLGDGPIADAIAKDYLGRHFGGASGNDTLLLGCTHFPLLTPTLRRLTGPDVAIVDCAQAVAENVQASLTATGLARPVGEVGTVTLQATDGQFRLSRLGEKLLPDLGPSPDVELIDL